MQLGSTGIKAALSSTTDLGIAREVLHFRRIGMRGFKRNDGLYEHEGRVIDRKPQDFVAAIGSKTVPAREAMHDIGVRLVFDEQMVVHVVQTFTDAAPYAQCPEGARVAVA